MQFSVGRNYFSGNAISHFMLYIYITANNANAGPRRGAAQ